MLLLVGSHIQRTQTASTSNSSPRQIQCTRLNIPWVGVGQSWHGILYLITIFHLQTTLNYTTLHNTTWHYTTLHYTTLHYTILHSLHYTTLHYTTLHYTTLNYTTLHYTTLHYTTLHYTSLHNTTLYSIVLSIRTLPYSGHTRVLPSPPDLAKDKTEVTD